MSKCMVCGDELTGRRTKKCEGCDPFWNKARRIIKNKDRKEVIFDTTDEDKNIALFAKEMKDDWDRKTPYHLCKYTWLPMILQLPKVKKKEEEDEEKFKKRKENREFLKYLVFSPDRIDSELKYEPGNIEVCSYLGNIMKNALLEDAFDSVIRGIVKSRLTIGRDEDLAKMLIMILTDFYSGKKFNQSELNELFDIEEEKN